MLLRFEIVCFLLSFGYVFYYLGDVVFLYYKKRQSRKLEKVERQEVREKKRDEQEKAEILATTEGEKKEEKKNYITPEESEQIREIAKRAHTNISR